MDQILNGCGFMFIYGKKQLGLNPQAIPIVLKPLLAPGILAYSQRLSLAIGEWLGVDDFNPPTLLAGWLAPVV